MNKTQTKQAIPGHRHVSEHTTYKWRLNTLHRSVITEKIKKESVWSIYKRLVKIYGWDNIL